MIVYLFIAVGWRPSYRWGGLSEAHLRFRHPPASSRSYIGLSFLSSFISYSFSNCFLPPSPPGSSFSSGAYPIRYLSVIYRCIMKHPWFTCGKQELFYYFSPFCGVGIQTGNSIDDLSLLLIMSARATMTAWFPDLHVSCLYSEVINGKDLSDPADITFDALFFLLAGFPSSPPYNPMPSPLPMVSPLWPLSVVSSPG